MVRRHIKITQGESHFRWRGGDVSRLEGLSDAVFALALTLIIVSLAPSVSFDNLIGTLKQIPVFAVCFAILLMIWYYHFQFHRRYGLEDYGTFLLNSILLFLILIYVYPLRFIFSGLLTQGELGQVSAAEGRALMAIYSGGFAGIFALLMGLNLRAWKLRDRLQLDDREEFLTKRTVLGHGLSASLGVISILLVLANAWWGVPLAFAGLIYFLMGPIHGYLGHSTNKQATAMAATESRSQKRDGPPRQERGSQDDRPHRPRRRPSRRRPRRRGPRDSENRGD